MTRKERIERITEQFLEGTKTLYDSDRYREYLKVMSRFTRYSYRNSLLIFLQNPQSTHVAGYEDWKRKFGRQVKKGAHAIQIIAPAKINVPIDPDDENSPTKEITYYHPISVFDIADTYGKDLPDICKNLKDDVNNFSKFKDILIEVSPVPVLFKHIRGNANGYYNSHEKQITVKANLSESHTIKTLLHEISHAVLHDSDHGLMKSMELSIEEKEVIAESVAYTCCQYYGIDSSDFSFGYLAGWSNSHEVSELVEHMECIRKTVHALICNIDEKMRHHQ